jgi:hypothetical protein
MPNTYLRLSKCISCQVVLSGCTLEPLVDELVTITIALADT